jgi:hypothetical protein
MCTPSNLERISALLHEDRSNSASYCDNVRGPNFKNSFEIRITNLLTSLWCVLAIVIFYLTHFLADMNPYIRLATWPGSVPGHNVVRRATIDEINAVLPSELGTKLAVAFPIYVASSAKFFLRDRVDSRLSTEFVFVRGMVCIVDPRNPRRATTLTPQEFSRRTVDYWLAYPTGWASTNTHVLHCPEAIRTAAFRCILNKGGGLTKRILYRQVEQFIYGKSAARLSMKSALRWLGLKVKMKEEEEEEEGLWKFGECDVCSADVFDVIEGNVDIWTSKNVQCRERPFGRMIAPQKDGTAAVAHIVKGIVYVPFKDLLEAAIKNFCAKLYQACIDVNAATLMRCSGGAVEPHLRQAQRKRRDATAGVGNSLPPRCIDEVYYRTEDRPPAKNPDRWRAALTVSLFASFVDVPILHVYDQSRSEAAWQGTGKEQSWNELHSQTVKPGKKKGIAICSKMALCAYAGDAFKCARDRGTAEPADRTPLAVWSAAAFTKKQKL